MSNIVSSRLRPVDEQADHYTYSLTLFTPNGPRVYAVDKLLTGSAADPCGVREIRKSVGESTWEVVVQFSSHCPYVLSRREDIILETESDLIDAQLDMIAKQKIFNERAQGLTKPREDGNEDWR